MIPKHLYHGSSFDHVELKPGFFHTGEEVHWDNVESNKFLYASTEQKEAYDQALASWLERHYQIERYKSDGNHAEVYLKDDRVPTDHELQALVIYVYVIEFHAEDGWEKNNNPHNGLTTEWKTPKVIPEAHIASKFSFNIHSLKNRLTFIRSDKVATEDIDDAKNFRVMSFQPKAAWANWR